MLFELKDVGSAIIVATDAALGAISVPGLAPSRLFFTSFRYNGKSDTKVIKSLRDSTFVYGFGTGLGELSISGYAPPRKCGSGLSAQAANTNSMT